MDLLRLDATYRPDLVVEGWSSLIWTERYSGNGEFVLKTPNIADARAQIPEGTFVSIRGSEEIMQVETHAIEPNDQGGVISTIAGSSFPANFLSERDTVGSGADMSLFPANWLTRKHYSPTEAAAALIWNHLINNSYSFTGPAEDANGDPMGNRSDWRLLIPNLELTVTDTAVLPWTDPAPGVPDPDDPAPAGKRKWALDRGTLDRPVFDILSQGKLGLRSVRTFPGTYRHLVTFANDGTFQRYRNASDGNKPRVEIYQGKDLSANVTFRYDAGQVEKPKYLYSIKGYKNIAHISSAQGRVEIAAPGVDPNISGVNRRVLPIDLGDLGDMDPDGNYGDPGSSDWIRIITQKGLVELQKYNKVAIFDGEISQLSNARYGLDYNLGDKVTLQAEYGFQAQMIISEYIRNQDENGETGYPTLSLVED